jgi:hypothetical protein
VSKTPWWIRFLAAVFGYECYYRTPDVIKFKRVPTEEK